ncbi:hypothetical protein [Nostoc sp. 'Peltigera membranacea cyanobiont' N6]|uniref:hypothetical protein n=1 Tax=Nostoc sp. 'Peltigera membranacea cyanobiont' N6 TaxID=1261031 RepID=UPI000CF30BE9|nr:hypothetical protein [Nostoc sp. 'Peltigera membranacea cyanobiont' N6]AVH68450.1 hypothetical protein NPM_40005 [Nostoc sp. 'Peltigera membranacea cyanobiont' N6]
MQLSIKSPLSWLDKILRLHFQAIMLVCLLTWTSLLATTTLQVQHSCNPMIHWSGELPKECLKKPNQILSSNIRQDKIIQAQPNNEHKHETSNLPKNPSKNPPDTVLGELEKYPDVTAGAIAIGVATGIALITSSPIALVLGSGFVTWLAIRTVLSIGAN